MKKTVSFLSFILVVLFLQLISSISYANPFAVSHNKQTVSQANNTPSYWISGRVGRVINGDTIMITDQNNNQHTIRLDQIDAPEAKQPYYRQSTNTLSSLIRYKNINAQIYETDRYNRLIGTVYINDSNVNLFMVRSGMAWAYTQFVRDMYYFEAEQLARQDKIGIWASDNEQIAPWIFREQNENNDIPTFRVE